MKILHRPVLLEEVIKTSNVQPGELVVDGTTGEGGHSEAFLERFADCRLICLDADLAIQQKARMRLSRFEGRLEFVHAWFDEWFEVSTLRPEVVLLDLGISVYHYEDSGRGFSFRSDEPLDMRLNPLQGDCAADLVNSLGEVELARILFEYGEETLSRRIARHLVEGRTQERIETAKQLADRIWEAVPVSVRYGRIHPATKSFQALRIAVNGELLRLERVLHLAFANLAVGGRLVVITFHSLEDRMVKRFFREQSKACVCGPEVARCECGGMPLALDLTRKPVVAGEEEVAANPPSRSAKLRAVKKLRDSRKGR
jgi:16S rRNA (cytosine1402-N4)-methyltransferase